MRLGFKASTVAFSLGVALFLLLGAGWMAGGEWLGGGDFENGLFWMVFACGGLYLLGVWVANAAARLMAGCALSAGPDGLRLYTLGTVLAWRDIESLRYWNAMAQGADFLSNIFKIASPHSHLHLTLRIKPEAFRRATGRLNTLDLIVFRLSMRINRADRKVFFACWPLDMPTQELLQSLARVSGAHGVELEFDEKTTGFA